ncbi:hypothetical protein DVK05_05915 [Halorubrum sp. Atlit-8R]|uniref:hypothetical protein n=1 Tax=unclassified Halorubrum TaxID=2642239 RepID=UPI000EF27C16|nr:MULTISPECIES: hypothetical protein [unclassified Halorubrum]RLM66777.1 hypothetical protein DVK08_12940 [Halorubrum sp. Atlit-9R]RLM81598.1 hypothetical protein DVK05_05915 [Halorubrum sp. Atlit-8R]
MTDEVPDTCARCGDTIQGRPSVFDLKPDYREYLEEERDLDWFPMGPVVVCCSDCSHRLDHLHEALSEHRAYGTDEKTEEIESMLTDELDGLDLDGVVDHGHFL